MIFDSSFWKSTQNTILENPLQPSSQRDGLESALRKNNLEAQILIRTSGTTLKSALHEKWICLSREAFLNSAHSVNHFFNLTTSDNWLSVLPTFHVGGLAQYARAFLSGSAVVAQDRWNAQFYVEAATQNRSRVSSLVPTQIFDLVTQKLKNPGLHTVFVGGGALESNLAKQALQLGWPLVATYGMTETCSQIAVQNLAKNEKFFTPLPHADVRLNPQGFLQIRCSSHLTGQFFFDGSQWLYTPFSFEWFTTEDFATLNADGFQVLGRGQDVVKILGENVSLVQVESRLSQFLIIPMHKMSVCALFDERRGSRLILVIEGEDAFDQAALAKFNKESVGFERISGVLHLQNFQRTALGKISRTQIAEQVRQNTQNIQWIIAANSSN